jgi:glycosyltransferase involved in cell wall biosynthesis
MIQKLTVIIITKNEAARIDACLRSVAWAHEIVVMDSGSTDDTVARCQAYTDKVFVTDWPGYGAQKNRALAKASGDWVLALDADEQLSDELAQEIRSIIAGNATHTAYSMPRHSSYLGKFLRHGDWANDRCTRLFRRGAASFSEDPVHERLNVPDGQIGKLKHPLYHETFSSLAQMLDKLNSYSTLSAQAKHAKGQRSSVWKAIGHGVWTFFRGYILKRGFLDGREGFLLAVSNAEGTYYRYLKMLYLK